MPTQTQLRIPTPLEIWRHQKSMHLYEIICVAIRNETGNLAVIYTEAPRADFDRYQAYDRDLSEFLGSDPDRKEDRFTFYREEW